MWGVERVPLTPLDIHNREFKRAFRGYNEEEVDQFLDEVVREFEALLRDSGKLREQVEEMEGRLGQYQALESTLRDTLVVAQQAAEDVKVNARKEADLIIREAEAEAHRRAEAAAAEVRRLRDESDELRKRLYVLRSRMRAMIETHLELLDRQVQDIASDEGLDAPGGGGGAPDVTVVAPTVKEE